MQIRTQSISVKGMQIMSTTQQTAYGLSTPTSLPFDEAVERITSELKSEGFGVLTTIDIQATLKEKIGVDRDRYVILGACNPQLANEAINAEPEIGLLLPCNVIVYESEGTTHVAAMDPVAAMGIVGNPGLDHVGTEARDRLARALEKLNS
jgi:uncharacterized protein (DUF302 family)